jgi:uncharacterized membrane protein YbaN (DUF454 family)
MKRYSWLMAGLVAVALVVAGAVGAALAGLPSRQTVVLLPGVVSWCFFARWYRRSFRAQHTDWHRGSLRH